MRTTLTAAGILVLAGMAAVPARAATCGRACLQNLISQYADAVVAHAPSQLPLAAKVRFTEDSHDLKLGEGLWKTATRKGGFRQDYLDVARQIAASHMVLYEGDTEVLCSVVLHVVKGKVAGIETLVFRVTPEEKSKPAELAKPLPGMGDPVPAGKRTPGAEMLRIVAAYAEGLRIGSFVKSDTPFAPDAYRVTNGVKYGGSGCVDTDCGLKTQKITTHPDLQTSLAAVDEEAGTVLVWMNLGATGSFGPGKALVTFQAFKIWDGTIHAMNAFRLFVPDGTQRGWPPEK